MGAFAARDAKGGCKGDAPAISGSFDRGNVAEDVSSVLIRRRCLFIGPVVGEAGENRGQGDEGVVFAQYFTIGIFCRQEEVINHALLQTFNQNFLGCLGAGGSD